MKCVQDRLGCIAIAYWGELAETEGGNHARCFISCFTLPYPLVPC